jgi:hypothetical protein
MTAGPRSQPAATPVAAARKPRGARRLAPVEQTTKCDLVINLITAKKWSSVMFDMSIGVGEHIFRAVVVYLFLFLLLRFVGKKTSGNLLRSICWYF